LHFTYDQYGRLATRELPSGVRLRYRYGSTGALQSIVQERWHGERVVAKVDSSRSRAKRQKLAPLGRFEFGNGIEQRTTFDARKANMSRRAIEGVAKLLYGYDDAGRIVKIDRDGQASEYGYDAVGRLVRAETPHETAAYTYDANGNQLAANSVGTSEGATDGRKSSSQRFEYEQGTNRLLAVDDVQYEYDAAGNPVRIGARRYEYDTAGRPTRLYEGKHLIAEYRYNFWGERIQKTVHADGKPQTRFYIYEDHKLIAEADERGKIEREYVYLDHHPIAMFENGEAYWIHTDHLGTPIAVTDARGRIIWKAVHRVFGEAIVDSDPDKDGELFTLNLRLPGQYADAESGTHYNYFRDYDPKTGRYLTPDPIGLAGGLNAFSYVGSQPTSSWDLLGLYQQDIHYYMTLFLAITAGVSPEDARSIALASAFVDENPATRPVEPGSPFDQAWSARHNQERLLRYHFVLSNPADGQTLSQYDNSNFHYPISNQSPQLQVMWSYATQPPILASGIALCSEKDVHLQFLGEYLHAFADTFSHRDSRDVPYPAWRIRLGIGHGLDSSEPDYTYNDGEWISRESRTFAMEMAIRDRIRQTQFANPDQAISDHQLDVLFEALTAFNRTREDEQNSIHVRFAPSADLRWVLSEKVEILNRALEDLGYQGIDLTSRDFRFDVELARQRRRDAFRYLDATAYPLAILDTP
jgi:RHS repeat-associated protein